jgi:hypothetical protein
MPEDTVNEDDFFIEPGITSFPIEEEAVEEVVVENAEERLPEFDPQFREKFEGLLYIGKLQRSFRWLGHEFVIRTPKVSDLLEIGRLHKSYANTVADVKAYQALVIASSVVSIDGQPLPLPFSNEETGLEAKFNYIQSHWYPWTLDKLYEEWRILDEETRQVHEALGKA